MFVVVVSLAIYNHQDHSQHNNLNTRLLHQSVILVSGRLNIGFNYIFPPVFSKSGHPLKSVGGNDDICLMSARK